MEPSDAASIGVHIRDQRMLSIVPVHLFLLLKKRDVSVKAGEKWRETTCGSSNVGQDASVGHRGVKLGDIFYEPLDLVRLYTPLTL
jgi:hypothetical protein